VEGRKSKISKNIGETNFVSTDMEQVISKALFFIMFKMIIVETFAKFRLPVL